MPKIRKRTSRQNKMYIGVTIQKNEIKKRVTANNCIQKQQKSLFLSNRKIKSEHFRYVVIHDIFIKKESNEEFKYLHVLLRTRRNLHIC